MLFTDQLQRKVELDKVPERIVSLVPSQTELLCALGLEEKIVGVTKFCVHPQGLRKQKTIVGGTKKVSFDKIKDLQPDIILCNKEENTPEIVEELVKIAPVHVSDVISLQDSLDLIHMYGEIFEKGRETEVLISEIKKAQKDFSQIPKNYKNVAYLIWKDPWMVVGGDTYINSMLELNGWENVFQNNKSRYPQVDLKDLQSPEIDLILLSSEPFPFKKKHLLELQNNINTKIVLVDGEFFSWYGSRTLPAFDYFKKFQKHLSISL